MRLFFTRDENVTESTKPVSRLRTRELNLLHIDFGRSSSLTKFYGGSSDAH